MMDFHWFFHAFPFSMPAASAKLTHSIPCERHWRCARGHTKRLCQEAISIAWWFFFLLSFSYVGGVFIRSSYRDYTKIMQIMRDTNTVFFSVMLIHRIDDDTVCNKLITFKKNVLVARQQHICTTKFNATIRFDYMLFFFLSQFIAFSVSLWSDNNERDTNKPKKKSMQYCFNCLRLMLNRFNRKLKNRVKKN